MTSILINRRTLLASGAALAATTATFAATPFGVKPVRATQICSSHSCHHSHDYQVSALMMSLGSPMLSAEEKGDLIIKAACPSCGTSLAADLTAQMACVEASAEICAAA